MNNGLSSYDNKSRAMASTSEASKRRLFQRLDPDASVERNVLAMVVSDYSRTVKLGLMQPCGGSS